MTIIVNGAPHYVDLGTKDSSGKQLMRMAVSYPQHLPKWYILAQKGTTEPWYGAGIERENQFGSVTFEERSKFFTNQTRGANVSNMLGNIGCYQRIVPGDAGPEANLTLWIDLLPTVVDDYARNEDGSIKTVAGQPEIIGQIPGFKRLLVISHDESGETSALFGKLTQRAGMQVDPANPTVRSVQYPLLSFKASSKGAWGNDSGMALWALDSRVDSIPEKMVEKQRCYPYALRLYNRDTTLGSVTTEKTAFGDESIVFTLKPLSFDPTSNQDSHLARRYNNAYFQRDSRYPKQSPSFSGLVIYQNYIDAVLKALYDAEKPYIDSDFHDFKAEGADEMYMYNLFGGHTLNGFLYRSVVPVVGTLSMDRNQIMYAAGGSDGTCSFEVLEKGAIADWRRYRDTDDEVQDKAGFPANHFYDLGWSLNGKMEMASVISQRGDTFGTFGTFQEEAQTQDTSEEFSTGSAIKARLANLPESTTFGTGVVRAGIYSGSAEYNQSQSGARVSTVLEVVHKRSKYLGAADGKWKTGAAYDQGYPGSGSEILMNFSRLWLPNSVRYRFWDAGINWWGRIDTEQAFCPAWRTVYSDDTSVMTADTVAMALMLANTVNDQSWRRHAGTTGVSAPVFLERIRTFITGRLQGRIDDRYIMEPVPSISSYDKVRGYSWHSGVALYADPMRTVAVNYAEVFRAEDRGSVTHTTFE